MAKLRIILWIAVAVALFVLGAISISGFSFLGRERATAVLSPGAPLGGSFQLVSASGEPVTEAIFRDKPSVTFFGYTHCPDVCPTALTDFGKWIEELGPDADKLRFVFVTVDPERDTPDVMRDYIGAFTSRIVGISGPSDAVRAMVKDYKIYSRKVPVEGSDDYLMDHTGSMILQDKSSTNGTFVGDTKVGTDTREPLKDGDRVRFGTKLTFVFYSSPRALQTWISPWSPSSGPTAATITLPSTSNAKPSGHRPPISSAIRSMA